MKKAKRFWHKVIGKPEQRQTRSARERSTPPMHAQPPPPNYAQQSVNQSEPVMRQDRPQQPIMRKTNSSPQPNQKRSLSLEPSQAPRPEPQAQAPSPQISPSSSSSSSPGPGPSTSTAKRPKRRMPMTPRGQPESDDAPCSPFPESPGGAGGGAEQYNLLQQLKRVGRGELDLNNFQRIAKESREQKRRSRQQLQARKDAILLDTKSYHPILTGLEMRHGDVPFPHSKTAINIANNNKVNVTTNVGPTTKTSGQATSRPSTSAATSPRSPRTPQRSQYMAASNEKKEPVEKTQYWNVVPFPGESIVKQAAATNDDDDPDEILPMTVEDALRCVAKSEREKLEKEKRHERIEPAPKRVPWQAWHPINVLRRRTDFTDEDIERNTSTSLLQSEETTEGVRASERSPSSSSPARSKSGSGRRRAKTAFDDHLYARQYSMETGRYRDYKEKTNWGARLFAARQ